MTELTNGKDPRAPLKVPGESRFPDAREVSAFHTAADTDSGKQAIHHTVGTGPNQAASGSHNHDGSNSFQLLAGVTISGAKGGNAALASVIAALVQLGATDSTSA